MSPPNRWYCADGIDLVNFGDYRAFMLVQDNLYKICVGQENKRFAIEKHYEILRQQGHQPSPVTRQNVNQFADSKWGIYLLLHHMIRSGLPLTFLDVGAFVGDVGIRFGNYFRTVGSDAKVYCFDPSLSGELIPYNIKLNGLEQHVTHVPMAVSDMPGYITFFQKQGHSDSAATSLGGADANTIVESIRLSDFLREKQIQNAFIKLDTENLESRILTDIGVFLRNSVNAVGFEFHAHQREMPPVLSQLLQTHVLFDIGYLPKPFCFRPFDASSIDRFVQDISRRPYGYTDVLAISRTMPALDELTTRLSSLTERPVEYSLVYP